MGSTCAGCSGREMSLSAEAHRDDSVRNRSISSSGHFTAVAVRSGSQRPVQQPATDDIDGGTLTTAGAAGHGGGGVGVAVGSAFLHAVDTSSKSGAPLIVSPLHEPQGATMSTICSNHRGRGEDKAVNPLTSSQQLNISFVSESDDVPALPRPLTGATLGNSGDRGQPPCDRIGTYGRGLPASGASVAPPPAPTTVTSAPTTAAVPPSDTDSGSGAAVEGFDPRLLYFSIPTRHGTNRNQCLFPATQSAISGLRSERDVSRSASGLSSGVNRSTSLQRQGIHSASQLKRIQTASDVRNYEQQHSNVHHQQVPMNHNGNHCYPVGGDAMFTSMVAATAAWERGLLPIDTTTATATTTPANHNRPSPNPAAPPVSLTKTGTELVAAPRLLGLPNLAVHAPPLLPRSSERNAPHEQNTAWHFEGGAFGESLSSVPSALPSPSQLHHNPFHA